MDGPEMVTDDIVGDDKNANEREETERKVVLAW